MTDNELIVLLRETNDNKYLELLIEKYTPYITSIAVCTYSKYKNKYTYEDIFQEIIIEFIKIAKSEFNLDNGSKFFTYMYKVLRLRVYSFIRDDKYFLGTRKDRLAKNDTYVLNAGSYSNKPLEEFIIATDDIEKETETSILINSIFSILNDREKIILYEYAVNEKTKSKINNIYNLDIKNLNLEIKRIKNKIENNICLY